MLASSCIRRSAGSALRSRSYSTAVSSELGFQSAVVDGVQIAAKDVSSPVTTLSFVIKAGSRYSTTPGVAHALQRFAFQNTKNRSGFRLTRETELHGGALTSTITRDSIILTARFLKEDLPFFFEALSDVVSTPQLARHELAEIVGPLLKLDYLDAAKDVSYVASETLHGIAFRSGLGLPLLSQPIDSINSKIIAEYKEDVYTKANLAIVASGASVSQLSELAAKFLDETEAGTTVPVPTSAVHGGESRIASTDGNAISLGFPTASDPEFSVLAAILGGAPSIKWASSNSILGATTGGNAVAKLNKYAGANLLSINVTGSSAAEVSSSAASAVNALKSVASGVETDALKKAVAAAKFDYLASFAEPGFLGVIGTEILTSGAVPSVAKAVSELEAVSAANVKAAAAKLLAGKKATVAIGKVTELAYADELGL
ncbi:Metalloenzyme, LuxS/M16 peptidase-like protein [Lipomyces japonicus]|uniref:Metalloenzyme, LuxS/M16 peptidase-like protein n=1 Tax=Lipomyces japonicus TaxID=56871 RepID=UPI0034D016A9